MRKPPMPKCTMLSVEVKPDPLIVTVDPTVPCIGESELRLSEPPLGAEVTVTVFVAEVVLPPWPDRPPETVKVIVKVPGFAYTCVKVSVCAPVKYVGAALTVCALELSPQLTVVVR